MLNRQIREIKSLTTKCCSHTLANMTANPLQIEHFSVFRVSAQSQRIRSLFAVNLSAFAEKSPTSKIFSTGSKFFQFAAQSPWSRTAVSMGSQCIRHQIDGDCAANPWRLQYTLANALRLHFESY